MGKPKGVRIEDITADAVLRQCPVTGGCPARMSKQSFLTQCQATKEKLTKKVKGDKQKRRKYWCDTCQGKQIPAEVEFVTKEQLIAEMQKEKEQQQMAKTQGNCELCKRKLKLTKENGKRVCTACAGILTACNDRPEVVVQAMKDAGKGHLLSAGESTKSIPDPNMAEARRQRDQVMEFFFQLTTLLGVTTPPERAPERVVEKVKLMNEAGEKLRVDLNLANGALCDITSILWPDVDVKSQDFTSCMDHVVQGVQGCSMALGHVEGQLHQIRTAPGMAEDEPVKIILDAISNLTMALEQMNEEKGRLQEEVEELTSSNTVAQQVLNEKVAEISQLQHDLDNVMEVKATLPPDAPTLSEAETLSTCCNLSVHIENIHIHLAG